MLLQLLLLTVVQSFSNLYFEVFKLFFLSLSPESDVYIIFPQVLHSTTSLFFRSSGSPFLCIPFFRSCISTFPILPLFSATVLRSYFPPFLHGLVIPKFLNESAVTVNWWIFLKFPLEKMSAIIG